MQLSFKLNSPKKFRHKNLHSWKILSQHKRQQYEGRTDRRLSDICILVIIFLNSLFPPRLFCFFDWIITISSVYHITILRKHLVNKSPLAPSVHFMVLNTAQMIRLSVRYSLLPSYTIAKRNYCIYFIILNQSRIWTLNRIVNNLNSKVQFLSKSSILIDCYRQYSCFHHFNIFCHSRIKTAKQYFKADTSLFNYFDYWSFECSGWTHRITTASSLRRRKSDCLNNIHMVSDL